MQVAFVFGSRVKVGSNHVEVAFGSCDVIGVPHVRVLHVPDGSSDVRHERFQIAGSCFTMIVFILYRDFIHYHMCTMFSECVARNRQSFLSTYLFTCVCVCPSAFPLFDVYVYISVDVTQTHLLFAVASFDFLPRCPGMKISKNKPDL